MNELDMGVYPKYPHVILESIEGQSHVLRYNTIPTIQSRQSVAEHIGRCVQIMLIVLFDLTVNPKLRSPMMYRLVKEIAIHDLAESLTGDIIGPTKSSVPEIQDHENEVYANLNLWVHLGEPLGNQETLWMRRLVHLVDLAEGAMYCTEEMRLGNYRMAYCLRNYRDALELQLKYVEEDWGEKLTSINSILHKANQEVNKEK